MPIRRLALPIGILLNERFRKPKIMKTKSSLLLLAAAALLAFSNISALALTVPVAQDTSSGKTGLLTSKTGKATSLTVADNQTTLLKFDLSNLDVVPATFDPGNVKSVI